MNNPNGESRQQQIADLLIAHRAEGTDWGDLKSEVWSKKIANEFLLCCLLDYQMPTDIAWRNGNRLVEDILGNPDDIWRAITSISENEWKSKCKEYRLHRFPAGHNRLWAIGCRICNEYDGDTRCIWQGKGPGKVLDLLLALGAGDQLSRMIVGALRDCGQIEGETSDVKADVHVCRVLGRALKGEQTDPETALQLARQLHPPDPWLLDAQLWYIGNHYCGKNPACPQCYLAPACTYALKTHLGPLIDGAGDHLDEDNWIFPSGEGVCIDVENGRWSDGAFFDHEDIPIEWHQAEPAPHVQDEEVWKHWLQFLETSPSAAQTLLTVARSRARARVYSGDRLH